MKKAILLAVWLVPAFVAAQTVPGVMSYQGRLLDDAGSPVVGARTMTFSIYAVAEGTEPALWTEKQTVQFTNGFYAVQLGALTAFQADLFDGGPRWMGVAVDTDAEMTPRQFIATVPYAFRALHATDAVRAASADAATNATNASNATRATSATTVTAGGTVTTGAVTASSVSATGAVSAGTVSATGAVTAGSARITGALESGSLSTGAVTASSVSATGTVSGGNLTTSGTLSAGNTTVGNLSVNGTLTTQQVVGAVVGGYRVTGGCSGPSTCSWTCSAWGDGRCSAASSTTTTAPTGNCSGNPATRAAGNAINIGSSISLCIQGVPAAP